MNLEVKLNPLSFMIRCILQFSPSVTELVSSYCNGCLIENVFVPKAKTRRGNFSGLHLFPNGNRRISSPNIDRNLDLKHERSMNGKRELIRKEKLPFYMIKILPCKNIRDVWRSEWRSCVLTRGRELL